MKFLDQEKRRQLLNERHSCKMFDSHYEFSSEELEEIAENRQTIAKLLQHAAMAFCDGYE
ncbi:hypothetical protein VN1247_09440 [Helicobacter pylori]|nr:hypothetical protein VN1247_09440 [Helicobacter pylori]